MKTNIDIVRCPLTGVYFRPCGSQIGVRVRLVEVSTYERLKKFNFGEKKSPGPQFGDR